MNTERVIIVVYVVRFAFIAYTSLQVDVKQTFGMEIESNGWC